MKNQRVGRKAAVEYLAQLYKFYEDNYNNYFVLNPFAKARFEMVIEAQEARVAHLFNEIVDKEEE